MLILQNLTYTHPNRDLLFSGLDLIVNKHNKIALIGNNGSGKSTLLKILAGELDPSGGSVKADSTPYYVPQIFGQYNQYTVAEALRIADKLKAMQQILDGIVTDDNMAALADDWTIEERCREAFDHWQLQSISLAQPMATLSGGQKTKVFLAGIHIHQPDIVLLDEPSNHLDSRCRKLLYNYVRTTNQTLVVVSHDRALLNLFKTVCELGKGGINVYGGNYDFYSEQRAIALDALNSDVHSREKALRKAKEVSRDAMERQQKLDARGHKKQAKAGMPTIMMNTMRNSAERSTARIKGVHADKIGSLSRELTELRQQLPDLDKMKLDLDNSALHKGKVLVDIDDANFSYGSRLLWPQPINLQLKSGERIAIKGTNGSGKTTLVKLLLGQLQPSHGAIRLSGANAIYIDQDYSLIDNNLTVYQQAQHFNTGALQEHDLKIRLNRFLFGSEGWDKPCSALSGGEKMRLMLCCLTINNQSPDIMVLDEPTNNLDIQNAEILTAAVNHYAGTLVVVSHDEYFLQQIGIERMMEL